MLRQIARGRLSKSPRRNNQNLVGQILSALPGQAVLLNQGEAGVGAGQLHGSCDAIPNNIHGVMAMGFTLGSRTSIGQVS